MARATGVGTALLTYFQERPGQVVTIDQLMKHFDLDRKQVQGNMYNLRKKDFGADIELLQQGMWRLPSTVNKAVRPAPGHRLPTMEALTLDIVKQSEDGQHMVGFDSNGDVYKISRLA